MADFAKQAKAQNVNIVNKFEGNLAELLAVLGKSDVNVMAPGTAMNIYKSSGSLNTEQVAEGAEITASTHKMSLSKTVELTYAKYRKVTGIESIGKMGYDVAVLGSNEAMLRDVQKAVRKSIYDGIKTGTGAAECAAGSTFQQQVATAWGAMQAKFEDEAATPVFFANPEDVAGYLGAANVTTQTAFGMSYLQSFMGLGNLLIDSNVPAGTVIATAAANLVRVSCAMVQRAMAQGDGEQRHAWGGNLVLNPSGDLYLAKADRLSLGLGGCRVGTWEPLRGQD